MYMIQLTRCDLLSDWAPPRGNCFSSAVTTACLGTLLGSNWWYTLCWLKTPSSSLLPKSWQVFVSFALSCWLQRVAAVKKQGLFAAACLLLSCNSVPYIPVHIHVIIYRVFQVRRANMYHWVISSGFYTQPALKAVSANLAFLLLYYLSGTFNTWPVPDFSSFMDATLAEFLRDLWKNFPLHRCGGVLN